MNENLKNSFLIVLMVILVFITALNNINNRDSHNVHDAFHAKVIEFMKRGGRNTAEDGKKRDTRLDRIEKHLGLN